MTPADLNAVLARTLADHKLSGGEKQALGAWLAEHAATEQARGAARHAAFELARAEVSDPASAEVIGWLEGVLRVVAPVEPAAGAAAGCEAEAFFAPGDACWRRIVHRIGSARKTMDLCVYTITDDRISNAILDAHRRGVKVRVISDAEKAGDAGSDVDRFRAAGVAVKFDDIDRGPGAGPAGHMHHKFAIFDGAHLVNGSYNWTRGAADANFENIVDAADPRLVARFAAEFERLWNRF